MKRKVILLVVSVLFILSVTACSENENEALNVTFGNPQWDSVLIHNAVAGYIAESGFGYTWDEVPGSTVVTFEGLMAGDVDVYMETWSGNLPTYQEDLDADRFQELSINFDDNKQGIYVPRYVIEGDASRNIEASCPDLKTLSDLINYADVFPDEETAGMGRIYGAVPGWEINEILNRRVTNAGLTEKFIYFQPGSDAALSTVLSSAYEQGKPVAAYYWEPTWLMGLYDFVLLEDEPYRDHESYINGETAFPPVKVTVCVNNDFMDKAPEYCEFLSNYKTSSDLTSAALAYMQESGSDYVETAKWLLRENVSLLDGWLPADRAETVKTALEET